MKKQSILIILCLGAIFLTGCSSDLHHLRTALPIPTAAEEQLAAALMEENLEGVKEAVELGADVDELPGLGQPMNTLHYYAKESMGRTVSNTVEGVELAKFLLDAGADVNYTDFRGVTLLMDCCGANYTLGAGCDTLFALLLEREADVDRTDKLGHTALDYAASYGSDAKAAKLLEAGAKPTKHTLDAAFHPAEPIYGFHPASRAMTIRLLAQAADEKAWKGIEPVLKAAALGQAEPEMLSVYPELYPKAAEILHELVAAFGTEELREALLRQGAELSVEEDFDIALDAHNPLALTLLPEYPRTKHDTLKKAIECGNYEIARYLVENGALADLSFSSPGASFPWEFFDNDLALALDNCPGTKMLELLLENGYPYNEVVLYQAICHAIMADNMEALRLLLRYDYDINFAYYDNGTVLTTAVEHGSLAIIRYLVSQGADLHADPNYLPLAAMRSQVEVVEYLLQAGIPVDIAGSTGETALIYAIRSGRLDMLSILIEAGADVNARFDIRSDGSMWETVLHTAAQCPSVRVVQALLDAGADKDAVDYEGCTAAERANFAAIKELLS